ncbi:SURF1 family protein [Marinimicrobium sp. C2-29]|uniref:SURF1 family protein n=1 Tax=Marinimicrobium sp. C2-29 TaxID=3139825 RepID=UPI003139AA65
MSVQKSPAEAQFTIALNWKVTLLCLLTLPVLLTLGFWQLDRAEQKQQQQAQLTETLALPPARLTQDNASGLREYRRLILSGRYLRDRNWLLDNRHRDGQVGYEVVTPFELEGGAVVLVNRGWVPAPARRTERPDPEAPEGAVTLFAEWIEPSDHPLLDGRNTEEGWPKVILAIEPEAMETQLGQPVMERYARLEAGSRGALVTDWPDTEVSATKHTAYAVQWFAMALALVLWFILANTNLWVLWRRR